MEVTDILYGRHNYNKDIFYLIELIENIPNNYKVIHAFEKFDNIIK